MKILILGGLGMLGHRLWLNLERAYDTWVTVRGDISQVPDVKEFPRRYILPHIDALRDEDVKKAMDSVHPDWVISCIGLVKQLPLAKDALSSIALNALLPHRLASICLEAGVRMVHFSTDCVFSGKKGGYVESDPSDAGDLYGRTKFLGEVAYTHTVTLRTSIIGRELKTKHGLVEWFLAQQGAIQGYRRAIFSGLTVDEISRILLNHVIPDASLSGVYHVSSDPISKYELLVLIKGIFRRDTLILPEEEFVSDRSLDSTVFKQRTGYKPPSWEEMIDELARSTPFYDRLGGRSNVH
jgi:dTDP-4-dehydrorhamnose reductase